MIIVKTELGIEISSRIGVNTLETYKMYNGYIVSKYRGKDIICIDGIRGSEINLVKIHLLGIDIIENREMEVIY